MASTGVKLKRRHGRLNLFKGQPAPIITSKNNKLEFMWARIEHFVKKKLARINFHFL